MKVGVLALQGAFREHAAAFRKCGCDCIEVRTQDDVAAIDALALPGGESTTIGKLLGEYQLMDPLRQRIRDGLPVFATCAGAIVLAREIIDSDQPRLGLMDMKVRRNAYGRQVDSFETSLAIPCLGDEPFPAVFIRAPLIESVGPGVEVLARYKHGVVLARQDNILIGTFHPELTEDLRLHRYFLNLINKAIEDKNAGIKVK
ncbi:MAG: pyridoxal 5'-phosphate synthase glutaminase subunit PdxT [Thermacetogeniaceae bacterium]